MRVAEARSPTDPLLDWLINPEEYEPLFDTSQEQYANAATPTIADECSHTYNAATPTIADEAQRRLPYFCVYLTSLVLTY